jgi:hypothetical protein
MRLNARAAEAFRIEEGDPTSRLNAKVEGRSVAISATMRDRMMVKTPDVVR